MEFLPYKQDANITAIDLGIGTGFVTQKFLQRFINAKVIAVDGAKSIIDYLGL